MNNRKAANKRASRERIQVAEAISDSSFREFKSKKLKFGFTCRMVEPNHMINVGKALDIIRKMDPDMKETVVQYNRTPYEKNRVFIYTNNEQAAEYLRSIKKLSPTPWKHWPHELEMDNP